MKSMKHTSVLVAAGLLMSVLLAGCTQNNGHIGKLFGSWVLVERVAPGASPLPSDATFYMSFQGDVVQFITEYEHYDYLRFFATWQRQGDRLTLNFDNKNDNEAPGQGGFAPPQWLVNPSLHTTLMVTELDGGHLELADISGSDEIIYKFDRTW